MPQEQLDDGQRRPALDLAQGPPVPEPVRVDALLDAGLRREPLAERAHVAVPQRLALERAEQRVASREAEPLPTFEPAVHGVGCVRRKRGGARLVALAVQYADGVTRGIEVFWEEGERLGDAQPRAKEHG